MFKMFGIGDLESTSDFLQSGKWGTLKKNNWSQNYTILASSIENYNSFCILTWPYVAGTTAKTAVVLYGHLTTEIDPLKYVKVGNSYAYNTSEGYTFTPNGVPMIEVSTEKMASLGSVNGNVVSPLDFSNIFESWPRNFIRHR